MLSAIPDRLDTVRRDRGRHVDVGGSRIADQLPGEGTFQRVAHRVVGAGWIEVIDVTAPEQLHVPPLVAAPGEALALLDEPDEPDELPPQAATTNNIPQAAAVRVIKRAGMVSWSSYASSYASSCAFRGAHTDASEQAHRRPPSSRRTTTDSAGTLCATTRPSPSPVETWAPTAGARTLNS
jgi:hypothetical protein